MYKCVVYLDISNVQIDKKFMTVEQKDLKTLVFNSARAKEQELRSRIDSRRVTWLLSGDRAKNAKPYELLAISKLYGVEPYNLIMEYGISSNRTIAELLEEQELENLFDRVPSKMNDVS